MRPVIFDAFFGLEQTIRHRPLGLFPTAIEKLPVKLPGGCELWVKREDQSGTLYGGNKVRRLEFLLGDVPESGGRLLTFGAYGSNHVIATGIYGQKLGCTVEAVLYPQPPSPRVLAALQIDLGAGVKLHPCRTYFGVPWEILRARRKSPRPRLITPGGTDPLGALGWWSGGLEIAGQVASGVAPRFDAVYVALGSGDTASGLLLGLGAAAAELVAVRVVPWPVQSEFGVRFLARRTAAMVKKRVSPSEGKQIAFGPRLRVTGRFVGKGYGYATPQSDAAVKRGQELGLKLDPVYTGKVFAALLADTESGRLAGKRVLFINTLSGCDLSALRDAGDLRKLPRWLVARHKG